MARSPMGRLVQSCLDGDQDHLQHRDHCTSLLRDTARSLGFGIKTLAEVNAQLSPAAKFPAVVRNILEPQ